MDKSNLHPLLNNARGFTLLELLVAMVMAMFVIIGVMTLTEMSTRSYEAQERVSTAQQGVRAAMDMMVRDIRMAGYNPMAHSNGPLTGAAITTATATTLQFGADLDASSAIDAENEQVTYNFTNEQLQITKFGWGGPQTVVDNVQAMNFVYRDSDGDVTADLNEIAMVEVNMTVRSTDSEGNIKDRNLTTRINCRNLRM